MSPAKEEQEREESRHPESAGNFGSIAEYFARVRSFSRNARLYLLVAFLIGYNFSVFNLMFNLYMKEVGYLEGQIGLINSWRAFGMTLIAIPAAILISRMRLKPNLLVFSILFAVFSFGLIETGNLIAMGAFAAFAGMSHAFFRVAAGPFYMRNSTIHERTHLFSFSFAMHILAGIIGSFIAGQSVTFFEGLTDSSALAYKYTLFVAIGISLLSIIPILMIKASDPSPEESLLKLSLDQLRRRGKFYFQITFSNFLVGLGAGLIIPFLNLYFRDRFSLSAERISFYYILMSVGMVAGTLAGPLLTPRLGLIRTIVLTQVVSIPFMLTLAYTNSLYLAVPAFVFRAGLMNMGVPIGNNFGMELSEKQERALVNALLMIAWTSSWMISVALGGYLIERYGYTLVLNISAGLYVLSSLVYYRFFSRVEQRKPSGQGWHIPTETRI